MLTEILRRGAAACQALFVAGVAFLPPSPDTIASHHLAVETLLSPLIRQTHFQGPRLEDLPERNPINDLIHWTNRLYPPQLVLRGCPECRTIRHLDIFKGTVQGAQQSCVLGVDYFKPDHSRSVLLVLAPVQLDQQMTHIDEAQSYQARIAVGADLIKSSKFQQIFWVPLLPELKSTLLELSPTRLSVRSLPVPTQEAADQVRFHRIQISFDSNGRVSEATGEVMGTNQSLVCDFAQTSPP